MCHDYRDLEESNHVHGENVLYIIRMEKVPFNRIT